MNHSTKRSVFAAPPRKRKDRDDAVYKGSSYKQSINTTSLKQAAESASSSGLLAGYMAYEFLTKGTLFGEKFDPAGAEVGSKPSHYGNGGAGEAEPKKEPSRSYREVAQLMKMDGVHIPGIVNPTQLARWIHM